MDDRSVNEFARTFLSVIAGVVAAIVTGALLIPVIEPFIGRHLDLNFFGGSNDRPEDNGLLVGTAVFGWLFIASMAGGFVCSLISASREIIHVLISSLVTLVVVFFISGVELISSRFLVPSLLILLGIPSAILREVGWAVVLREDANNNEVTVYPGILTFPPDIVPLLLWLLSQNLLYRRNK